MYKLTESDKALIKMALKEDIGERDLTSSAIAHCSFISAQIIAKEEGIVAGIDIANKCFLEVDSKIKIKRVIKDGEIVKPDSIILELTGCGESILSCERTTLNFLGSLSGIATLTSKFVQKASPSKIYDTRKTTPGFRRMEKYAVKIGGGYNHRFGLFDEILIKDNHIKIAGGIKKAILLVKKKYPKKKIEVETENLEQVREAISQGADIIMLDNFDILKMKEAISLIRKKDKNIKIEVSGGINLSNIEDIARFNPDIISIGALTHSAKALDVSLEIK
ncbi:MAG: carboxylating nicotinate-nucleotide diphosphorylase [bacterium]